MADEVDCADRDMAILLEARIAAVRRRKPELVMKGQCHFCDEATTGLFCDLDCSQDYEKEQQAKKRAGIK